MVGRCIGPDLEALGAEVLLEMGDLAGGMGSCVNRLEFGWAGSGEEAGGWVAEEGVHFFLWIVVEVGLGWWRDG